MKSTINFAAIVQNIYSVVESELVWWLKVAILVTLIANANKEYALWYWFKNRYIK